MLRGLIRNLVSGPIAPQLRRFVLVGTVAASAQMVLLWLFVDRAGLHYLLGALIAIELTIMLSYVLNNAWTFRADRKTTLMTYVVGLLKTNLVRGTAIPIQLALLLLFVDWLSIQYLLGNGVAIVLSGVYRYVLDARWTWA
jgi:putative flippase GtrA